MSDSKQRKTGAMLSYVSIIVSTLVQLLYTPFLISKLGQSEYGLYSLIASIIGYLTVLDLGFGNAIIVYTAKYRAAKKYEEEKRLHGMFKKVFSIIGIVAALIGIILFLNVNNLFGKTMTPTELSEAKIMMLILSFNLFITFQFSIYSSIISAYEKFTFQKIMAIMNTILKPLLMIPLLFLGYKSIAMTVVITIVNIIVLLSNYFFCKKKLDINIKFIGFDKNLFKTILGYSIWIFLGVIVDKINWSVDQFVLGSVVGTIAVSIYSAASTLNTLFINLSTAISGVMLPKMSKMVAKKATDKELTEEFIKVGRIQYLVVFLMASGLVLFGKEFIIAWVGKEFETSYYVALILILPLCIPLIQNLGLSIMQAKNKFRFRTISMAIMSIFNIILSIFLAKRYGPIGSAIGTAISLILINIIVMNIYYCKKIKIDIVRFWKEIVRMTIPYIIPVVVILILKNYIKLHGYKYLVFFGGIYTIIYFITSYLFSMNKYEKKIFRSIYIKIKKILNRIFKKLKKYILPIITLIITILTIIFVLKLNILPNKYLILLIIIELILFLLSLIQLLKKKTLKVIGIIISIISILINITGLYYINNTNKFIDINFTGDIKYSSTYYVIANKEDNATIDDIENIKYYKYSNNVDKAKELLGEYNYQEVERIEDTIKKNEYLLIDEYNYKLIKEETKIIYEFNIEWSEKRVSNKQESYNIFIGGRDFTRTLMDFNMIMTINTKTKTILLTNIPRDYYMYIPEYKMNDSLEFMGLLGENTTMNALENLLDTKIDLYASIYTEGLVEIVDLLGGIEYCSDMTFTTTHAKVLDTYNDSYGEKLTIYEGCQHLNGIETLTLARERKHVGSDRQRQKNCTKILKTIMNDSLSMTTLTNYEELLNKVSNLYQTNIDKTTIKKLIKSLINNKYTILEQSLDGSDETNYIRLGTVQSYVMYPKEGSVNNAKTKIKEVLQGK